MCTIRWCCLVGLLAVLVPAGWAADPAPEKDDGTKVDIRVVKYDGLADTVRQLRGKVVVVDFWGTTCVPCRKEFHNLVELNRQYAGDGLAAVSVCVAAFDPHEPPKEREEALKFLRKQEAAFPNLILDEKLEVVTERLRIEAIPCVYVFNREGKWYQFKDGDYAAVKKLVPELLKAK